MRYRALAAMMSVAVAAAAVAAQPPIVRAPRPAADFAELPFIFDPKLSPDGTHIAAKVSVNGRQALVVRNLFDATQMSLIRLGDSDLNDWSWVNDGWLVITVGATTQAEGEDFYVTRLSGVSADGKTAKPIAFNEGGQNASVVWRAQDGTPRVLMSMQKSIYNGADFWPDVSMVDVSTGRVRKVVSGEEGVMRWYADPAGDVRMGVGYDDSSRSSRLLFRASPKNVFRTVDRSDPKHVKELTLPFLTNDPVMPAVTIASPHDNDELYELNLGTMAIGKKLFGVDGYDIDDVTLTPDGKSIAGVFYTSDSRRVHWFDPELAKVQADLDKAVAPRSATILSLSQDQKKMIVEVGSASQPGSYYFYDAEDGRMQRFANANAALKGATLGPVSTYRFKARDGLSLEAILTLPAGRAATNLPLVLLPHGGPEARDSAEFDWWAQFLADRGYAVVQPNYRGSTGYGKALEAAGDGEWGRKMQDDLNDAVDDLAKKGVIDPKRVCIAGASYGGYAALRGAERDGARYRCAISYAGVADIPGMMRYDSQFLYANASRHGWTKSAPDLRAVSPINDAQSFGTPVLLMHGKKDLRVPVRQSRLMAERLRAAGKSVEYIEQPLGDHHFTRQADRLQFLQAMEAFLTKYNPA